MNRPRILVRPTEEILTAYPGLASVTAVHPDGQATVKGCDWRSQASCRMTDPELFFPNGTSGPTLLQIEQAKRVCGGCPVSLDCLAWAIDTGQDAGIWGGLTEDERRAVKRRMGW